MSQSDKCDLGRVDKIDHKKYTFYGSILIYHHMAAMKRDESHTFSRLWDERVMSGV